MARQTITKLVDDIDGGTAHETVRFALDGHEYEIDLSSKNAKKLRTEFALYIEKGNRVTTPRGGAARGGRGRVNGGDQNRAIREWAHAQGLDISERGRIKKDIIEQFHAASR